MVLERAVPLALVLCAASPVTADTFHIAEDQANRACIVVREKPPTVSKLIIDDSCVVFAMQAQKPPSAAQPSDIGMRPDGHIYLSQVTGRPRHLNPP